MTIQSVGGNIVFPSPKLITFSSFTGHVIDASGEKVAMVFSVPKTGNIRYVGFRVQNVTSSQTLRAGIQTVSSGDPTGSAYGSMVAGTQASPAASTFYTVTLGTDAAATIGDVVAAVIEFDSTAGNLSISSQGIGGGNLRGFPYVDHYTTAWSKQQGSTPILTIGYDDGTYYEMGCIPCADFATTAFGSGSTPDEYAIRINVPVPVTAVGWWIAADIDAAADIVLYEGTTAQRTTSLDSANRAGSGMAYIEGVFSSPFSMAANTTYYLALKPTTASTVGIQQMTVPTANAMSQLGLGTNCYQATRTDAGSWSTNTAIRPWMGLVVSGFDDGAGSGGLVTLTRSPLIA